MIVDFVNDAVKEMVPGLIWGSGLAGFWATVAVFVASYNVQRYKL